MAEENKDTAPEEIDKTEVTQQAAEGEKAPETDKPKNEANVADESKEPEKKEEKLEEESKVEEKSDGQEKPEEKVAEGADQKHENDVVKEAIESITPANAPVLKEDGKLSQEELSKDTKDYYIIGVGKGKCLIFVFLFFIVVGAIVYAHLKIW